MNDDEMTELAEYRELYSLVGLCYDRITFGKFSKPNTDPKYIEESIQGRIDDAYKEGRTDQAEEAEAELAALRARVAALEAHIEKRARYFHTAYLGHRGDDWRECPNLACQDTRALLATEGGG